MWVLPFGYPILVYPDQQQKNYSASDKLSAPPPYQVRPRTSDAPVQIRKATSPWRARQGLYVNKEYYRYIVYCNCIWVGLSGPGLLYKGQERAPREKKLQNRIHATPPAAATIVTRINITSRQAARRVSSIEGLKLGKSFFVSSCLHVRHRKPPARYFL